MDARKRKRSELIHIGNAIHDALNVYGRDVNVALSKIQASWKKIVGDAVARNARPAALRSGVLYVQASSSVWLQQLQFLKADMMEKINGALGADLVRDVRFRIGKN